MIRSRFHRQVIALLSGLVMLFSLLPAPGAAAEEDLAGILQFNELQVSASPYYNTQGYDWFELKNTTRSARNLKGWSVVLNGKKVFTFSSGSIGAGEYLTVFASGLDRRDDPAHLHTSFSLSSEGESVILCSAQGQVMDAVDYTLLKKNQAWSLQGDGTWAVAAEPTPGKANG